MTSAVSKERRLIGPRVGLELVVVDRSRSFYLMSAIAVVLESHIPMLRTMAEVILISRNPDNPVVVVQGGVWKRDGGDSMAALKRNDLPGNGSEKSKFGRARCEVTSDPRGVCFD